MQKRIRVAVVGAGHLGKHHARLYAGMPEAELLGVADSNFERARDVAAAYGATASSDYRDFLGRVDAASVAVPTESHFTVARDFIRNGCPVLVEKPFTRSLDEADELLALAARYSVPIQVGHIERFNPAFLAARRYLGVPLYIHCERVGPFSFRSLDVGVVLDLMIHDLDILLDLVQAPVQAVEAVGCPVLSRYEDLASVRLTFANGSVATLMASRLGTCAVRQMHVFQADSCVWVDYDKHKVRLYRKRATNIDPYAVDPTSLPDVTDFVFRELLSVEDIPVAQTNALEQELATFLNCVMTGDQPICSGAEARARIELAMRIVTAINGNLSRHLGSA